MEKLLFTNKAWFLRYLMARRLILGFVFFSIFLVIKPEIISDSLGNIVQISSISLLLVLLIFDYIQVPMLFELYQRQGGIKIGLYIPDTRYAIYFYRHKMKYYDVEIRDKISIKIFFYFISIFNRGELEIEKESGQIMNFPKLDLSWATQKELDLIQNIFNEHNKNTDNKR